MTNETPDLPEWPTLTESEVSDKDDTDITQRIDEFLRVALNEDNYGLGPQVAGNWMVIVEVNSMEGRGLRMIDSGLMPWEWKGMLQHTLDHKKDADLFGYGDHDEDDDDDDGSHA